MATRQEIIVGYTLALWTGRVTDNTRCACYTLQELNAYTGAPLTKIPDEYADPKNSLSATKNPPRLPLTMAEINKEVDTLFEVNDYRKGCMDSYFAKGDSKLIDSALVYHNLTRVPVDSDLILCENTKINIMSDKSVSLSKANLNTIGESRLPNEFAIDEFIHPDTLAMPKDIFMLNGAHDVVDALSYVLQGRCSYTGNLKILTDEARLAKAREMCWVARTDLATARSLGADIVECDRIEAIINYVEPNLSIRPFPELGQHIDNNLEKLPTLLRHWAL